jgi:BlaI family penicillinase repressor
MKRRSSKSIELSDAEWSVMNLIWETQPTEASDVVSALAKPRNWSEATIKTMLHRLVKKGALTTESLGKKYRYRAAVKRNDCVRWASQAFFKHVFGGHAGPALLHLVQASPLSADELARIREVLDAKLSGNKE